MIQLMKKTKITKILQHTLENQNTRWIVSILFTSIILMIFVFLSNINLNTKNFSGNKESNSKENISLVKIIKKAPPKKIEVPQNPPQEIIKKQENVIASPNAKLVEEKPEVPQIQEIPQENFDEVLPNDFPDDIERAETFDPNAIYNPYAEEEIDGDSKYGSTEVQKAKESYKTYVKKRIAAKKLYPLKARAQNQTGNVKIKIVILPDGNLESVEIVEKSEYELLNQAALLAVKKASPFKKMSNEMLRQEYTFTLEFTLE